MANFKIMNVLLSDTPQFLGSPAMLCRSDRLWRRDPAEAGAWLLEGPGTHDFMTFFNAVSVQKWRTYTTAAVFGLHLELKGAACTLTQTRADSFSYYSEPIAGTERAIAASDEWHELDLILETGELDVLASFKLAVEGDVCLRNAYYYAVVEDAQVRPVELALCTTTFKKEEYITRNIGLVRDEILGSSADLISQHFHMHVVDNGRTLDVDELSGPGVTIHPNDNAGGAGGFARGMICAMEQEPRATHVLLMDDDVLIAPESIIRTYNLLALANDEYKDGFVSGAMMNMDEPYVRWEEMGFIGFDGAFHPIKPVARMDVLHDVVDNETFDIPSYLPRCEDQQQHYAAWWYCVIPMTQIEANGLPLPVFVRGDDAEYSRRCKPRFMTMNGICIWHLSFHLRYNAAQERYQMTRNMLVDQYASEIAPMSDTLAQISDAFRMEMEKFNYANAELVLQGIEDFLKGPEWLMQPVAQQAFMDANKHAEKLRPISEMTDELAELGVDLARMSDWQIWRDRPFEGHDERIFRATYNGQRRLGGLVGNYVEQGKVAVIDNVGWAQPRGKYQKAEAIVAVDIPNRKCAIRRRDVARFQELQKRYQEDKKQLRARHDELKQLWRDARPKMTTVEFWKSYLGIA